MPGNQSGQLFVYNSCYELGSTSHPSNCRLVWRDFASGQEKSKVLGIYCMYGVLTQAAVA